MRTQMKTLVATLAVAGATMMPTAASAVQVGLELFLLTDVSGSVDANEYNLQKTGYVQAFQSAAVQNAIINSQLGSIAVAYGEWSSSDEQRLLKTTANTSGWFLIDSIASANAFAAAIQASTRSYTGLTAPGSALNWAAPMFTNDYEGLRQVIDVSGDGSENDGSSTIAARNAALAGDVDAINGLPILGSENGLLTWYQTNIQGGIGSFTEAAASFSDFSAAIEKKLIREINNNVPEPLSLSLVGIGLLGLGLTRRRRQK